jgi:hypothetical protein
MAFDALHQQTVLFGGEAFPETWVWLVPSINLVPQAPVLVNDGKGNYQVQITVKNQSNVPLNSISLSGVALP